MLAAYHNDVLVGAIACRLEAHGNAAKMYIVTLGVLAPYRGMRVGESSINYIHRQSPQLISTVSSQHRHLQVVLIIYNCQAVFAGSRLLEQSLFEAGQDSNIKEAYLHVQTNNEEAICFYKQFDFVLGEVVANYYKRLAPPDAVILRRTLVPQG